VGEKGEATFHLLFISAEEEELVDEDTQKADFKVPIIFCQT
jgi:hypothetical protein